MHIVLLIGSGDQQCCGQTFSVGNRMTWTATTDVHRRHLARSLGIELAETVTHQDASHRSPPNGSTLTGTVERIDAAFCEMRELVNDPDGYTQKPVPGSAWVEPRQHATRTEDETDPAEWVGYLVHLDAV